MSTERLLLVLPVETLTLSPGAVGVASLRDSVDRYHQPQSAQKGIEGELQALLDFERTMPGRYH